MGSWFVGLVLLALLVSPAAHADVVRLRVGTLAVDGSRYMEDVRALGKEIEVRTRRRVRLDIVAGGRLGDERAMAAQVAKGTLDGGGFSETGLIALVPEMTAWQYAGLFGTYAEVDRATAALDADIRARFRDRRLVFAMWADLGFAHVFSTAPITSLGELLKIATPQLALPLDGSLTEAILGGARAWALPPLYMMVIGAHRARSMTALRYRYVIGALLFSARAWAKLSPAQQQTLVEVCRDYEPKLRASWRAETERGITALRKAGVALRPSSDAELAAFFEASARARQGHARGATGELVGKIVAVLAR